MEHVVSWGLLVQSESQTRNHTSVLSYFLWHHGPYSPWNSPGQNTRVGSLSLLQGIFPTQGSNPGLLHCRWILYQLSYKGSPRILEWVAYPFSRRSSWPGIEPGSPALQEDSLPTEPWGKPLLVQIPLLFFKLCFKKIVFSKIKGIKIWLTQNNEKRSIFYLTK